MIRHSNRVEGLFRAIVGSYRALSHSVRPLILCSDAKREEQLA